MTTRKPIVLISGLFEEVNTPTDGLDFAGNTTTNLTEGTNLYYTDTRARLSISAGNTGTGYGAISYNNSTGVLTYSVVTDLNIRGALSVAGSSGLTYNSTTGVFGTSAIPNSQLANSSITFGVTPAALGTTVTSFDITNLKTTGLEIKHPSTSASHIIADYAGILFTGAVITVGQYIDVVPAQPTGARVITLPDATGTVALLSSISATNTGTGYGSISYNNTTGVLTYSVVTDLNIRSALSATNSGSGYGSISYNSTSGAITYSVVTDLNIRGALSVTGGSGLTYNSTTGVFGTSAIPNAQLANSSLTVGSTSIALGSTATSIAGLTALTATTLTAGTGGHIFTGSSSGTTTVVATAAASGTLTLPATTSTLAVLGLAQSYSAAQRGTISVLTSSSSITPDFAVANNFSLTLGVSTTIQNPSNLTAGQSGAIVITQDATGSRTIAYGSQFKFSGGTPTATTTANAVDVLVYYVESATRITARLITNVA